MEFGSDDLDYVLEYPGFGGCGVEVGGSQQEMSATLVRL